MHFSIDGPGGEVINAVEPYYDIRSFDENELPPSLWHFTSLHALRVSYFSS